MRKRGCATGFLLVAIATSNGCEGFVSPAARAGHLGNVSRAKITRAMRSSSSSAASSRSSSVKSSTADAPRGVKRLGKSRAGRSSRTKFDTKRYAAISPDDNGRGDDLERVFVPPTKLIQSNGAGIGVVMLALLAGGAAAIHYSHGIGGGGVEVISQQHFDILRALHLGGAETTSSVKAASSVVAHSATKALSFDPVASMIAGLGAGLTRALSRCFTFPLDTIKTRQQVSRMSKQDIEKMPPNMRKIIQEPLSFKGLFDGFGPFILQAGPSNAVFFLVYDAANFFTATHLPGLDLNLVHFMASSIATIPCNLVRIPAEVVKQRLQVGQASGGALNAVRTIVAEDGLPGLFVGGGTQLMREIPFNGLQFAAYEFLKTMLSPVGGAVWFDGALGGVSSGFSALCTQPFDTVKTRLMTKSVPALDEKAGGGGGGGGGGEEGSKKGGGGGALGFLGAGKAVLQVEGLESLYLGWLPRFVLVTTGGMFYFLGQDLGKYAVELFEQLSVTS